MYAVLSNLFYPIYFIVRIKFLKLHFQMLILLFYK